jgi:mono/diheme cytochrome c family protein
MKSVVRWVVLAGVALLLVIQVLPFGRDHTNPPVRKEPAWDAPETRALAVRACFDCHSNQTVWPWYSNVAPISWLVWSDVVRGRKELDFSEWDRPQKEARESAGTVRKGSMPPWYSPWAKLDAAEREALSRGLEATLGGGAAQWGGGWNKIQDGLVPIPLTRNTPCSPIRRPTPNAGAP